MNQHMNKLHSVKIVYSSLYGHYKLFVDVETPNVIKTLPPFICYDLEDVNNRLNQFIANGIYSPPVHDQWLAAATRDGALA